jgi:hypothetical protein
MNEYTFETENTQTTKSGEPRIFLAANDKEARAYRKVWNANSSDKITRVVSPEGKVLK